MGIREQKTRVMLGDVDISDCVAAVDLQRLPGRGNLDQADVTLFVERYSEEGGALVVHCKGPERLTVRPEKRIVL